MILKLALATGFAVRHITEIGSQGHTLDVERDAGIKSAILEDYYCRRLMLRSCSAHEYGSALATPVTVRSAGALPSMIAAMMRGDTKARGASRRICRSPWPSPLAISEKEAIRPR